MINQFIENKAERLLFESKITHAHIDVEKCAKHLSIEIDYIDLESDISGFLVNKDSQVSIAVNKSENGLITKQGKHKPSKRQRFTIAHEIGHFILHHDDEPLFIERKEMVMFRNLKSTSGEYRKEREANAFAAALLMPQAFIEIEIKKLISNDETRSETMITLLAQKFDVSEQAMSFRLSNLGYELGYFI